MKDEKIKNNRNDFLSVLAITEDIQRTATQLYDKLRTLLGNPRDIDSVTQIIEQLNIKVTTLTAIKLAPPFIESEAVLIPSKTDDAITLTQTIENPAMLQPDAVVNYTIEPPPSIIIPDDKLLPPEPMLNPPNPVSSRSTLPKIKDLKDMGETERQQYMEEQKEIFLKQRQVGPKRLPQKGKKIDRPTPPKKESKKKVQRPPKKFNKFKGLDENQE